MPDNDGRRPQGGDAVRLAAPWRAGNLSAGEIGVLQGVAGQTPADGVCVIVFNHRTFRGQDEPQRPERVSSTGVYTTAMALNELRPTDETTTLTVWRWNNQGPGPGNRVEYTVTVPVWEWEPTNS